MLRIDSTLFYWMVTLLEQMKVNCRLEGETQQLKEAHRKDFLKHLEFARSYAQKLALHLTQKQVERLTKNIWENSCSYKDILAGLTDVTTRFSDELVLYHIPSEHQEHFDRARSYMEDEVIARFPDTRYDLEEAGKCLALGRGTACVLHLARVVESGLRYVSKEARTWRLALPEPCKNSSWSSWIDPIEGELNKERKNKVREWNAVEPSYAQMAKLLRAVSQAWRHPTMNGEDKYTIEEARDILSASRELMQHVATAKLS